VGPILDGLGVVIDLADGDLVADALVIAKVVSDDGSVSVSLSTSDAMSWLDQLALVTAASDVVRRPYEQVDTDGD
jgi:hypothetical protein